jgi:DNA-binding NarL/FixJ family response regulator
MEERTIPPPPPAPRVLVVDDDPILGEALCQLLLHKDLVVVGMATNGPEAVSLARSTEPDVVLMDFRMPGMDGLEATSLIQAHSPMTQSVMFTAYDDESLNREASETGVYCLLVKGCNPELIVDVIKRAAAHKREMQAPEELGASAGPYGGAHIGHVPLGVTPGAWRASSAKLRKPDPPR